MARPTEVFYTEEHMEIMRMQIAGLAAVVCELTGEDVARVPRELVEEPPEVEYDDDPVNGDWLYRLVKEDDGQEETEARTSEHERSEAGGSEGQG